MKTRTITSIALLGALACASASADHSSVWKDPSRTPDERADAILKDMTLKEKIAETILVPIHTKDMGDVECAITNGWAGMILQSEPTERLIELQKLKMANSRLGVPLLFQEDVIHGWRTIMPMPLASSCSWDEEAIEKGEAASAKEAAAAGMNLTYAPMVDICEDPRWGRIMETHGEDPYLSGRVAAARVRGFQGREPNDLLRSDKVASCVKHFLGYASLQGGLDYRARDFSWRDVQETYAVPYRWAAKAGVSAVMCSYLQWNGQFVSFSPALRDLLRGDIGFDGLYMTDWGTMEKATIIGVSPDKTESARRSLVDGGIDMDMASFSYCNLEGLVREGKVPVALVDAAAKRALRLKFACGLFEDPFRHLDLKRRDEVVLSKEMKAAAQEMAEKSIVLLKNDGVLPLASHGTVALAGAFADNRLDPMGQWRCKGDKADTVTLLEGLRSVIGAERVEWNEKLSATNCTEVAAADVPKSDVVIVALGENCKWSGEYFNVARLELPADQIALARSLKAAGKKVVAVVYAGRPVVLRELVEVADAIVYAWFPGTMGGPAVARILAGEVNPQAKTCQGFYCEGGQVLNTYRAKRTWNSTGYIDLPERDEKKNPTNPVLYPFGYGLSYTTYAYSKPVVDRAEFATNESVVVSVEVTNTGSRAGREIVQLYVRDEVSSVFPRERELREFSIVELKPGETKKVSFTLASESFAIWDHDFRRVVEPGEFTVFVGPDSATGNSVKVVCR